MTLDEIDRFCHSLPGVAARYPFESNPAIRAWCIGRRMFAWANVGQQPLVVQLKANPSVVESLVTSYPFIAPGYHMNKRHWISVTAIDCDAVMMTGLLEDAHGLIAAGLPRAERMRLVADQA